MQLSVTATDLRRAGIDCHAPVPVGTSREIVHVRRVDSLSDLASGELGIVEDSFGWLAIVAGAAAAADRLGLVRADRVRLGDVER
ncbi:MAG: hypothetical protein KY460_02765 [Actinobacteria bacterium]|nr:hypothetical protein [Actinomycetota bacterium]